jgi:hypothetical protein
MTEREALKLALEKVADALPAYIDGVASREYLSIIHKALAQPEQEPVAWLHTKIEGVAVSHRPADLDKHPDRWTALYKDPPPCPTCEALARTVMMDQTGRDA